MPLILIHYDLHQRPDVEYPDLIPILTGMGARRLTSSTWVVTTDRGVADVRDDVQICALPGDRFVVAEIKEWRTISTLNRIEG